MAGPATTRIILADGDGAARAELRAMLAGGGYDVVGEAGDGLSTVSLVRTLKPNLTLVAVELSGMDGLSAAAAVHRERSGPVLLLLTCRVDQEIIERAIEAGVFGCLIKPVTAPKLIAAIEVTLQLASVIRAQERMTVELREQIKAQQLMERAKAILATDHGLTEAAAMAKLEKLAEQSGKSLSQVASSLLVAAQARR